MTSSSTQFRSRIALRLPFHCKSWNTVIICLNSSMVLFKQVSSIRLYKSSESGHWVDYFLYGQKKKRETTFLICTHHTFTSKPMKPQLLEVLYPKPKRTKFGLFTDFLFVFDFLFKIKQVLFLECSDLFSNYKKYIEIR